MTRSSWCWRTVATVLLAGGLVGCGTTVPGVEAAGGTASERNLPAGVAGGAAAVGSSGGLSGVTNSAGSVVPAGATIGPESAAGQGPGQVGGAASPATGGDGRTAVGAGSGTGPTESASLAPGITATAVYVGAEYTVNNSSQDVSIGGNNIGFGPQQLEQQIVIDDINAHGGIAGRKLVPVWYRMDATSTATAEEQAAQECSQFTQDHHVVAAMTAGLPTFDKCIENAGAGLLNDNLAPNANAATYRQFPALIDLGAPNLDRLGAEMLTSFEDQHYLAPWDRLLGAPGTTPAKVGIISFDYATYREMVDAVLVPGLSHLGYAATTEFVTTPMANSQLGNTAADISGAVLRFDQLGVDHVIIVDAGGTLTLLFLNQAQSQHYYPRYGGASSNGFQALLTAGDVPADQLRGAIGFGWSPLLDLTQADDPDNGIYSSPARRACVALMSAHGEAPTSTTQENLELQYCDEYGLLRAALDRGLGTGRVPASAFVSGIDQIGSSFAAADTFGITLSTSQHDAIAHGFDLAYTPACTCMRYVGPMRSVG